MPDPSAEVLEPGASEVHQANNKASVRSSPRNHPDLLRGYLRHICRLGLLKLPDTPAQLECCQKDFLPPGTCKKDNSNDGETARPQIPQTNR